jgi:hypothetical protein
MDLIPSLACGAHFVILTDKVPEGIDDYVSAGRAVQRLWLTTTKLGLQLQPEITPIIFSRYVRNNREFSREKKQTQLAKQLLIQTEDLIGREELPKAMFMGRIGKGEAPFSRSLRFPLDRLKSSLE